MFDLASGLIALGAISGLAVAAWLVSVKKRDVSIFDGLWPVLIWVGGLVYAWTAPLMPRGWVAMTLLTIWARASASTSPCAITASRRSSLPEDPRKQPARLRVEESLPRVPASGESSRG
jgi:steroid 5-alpha reductase family enzyme